MIQQNFSKPEWSFTDAFVQAPCSFVSFIKSVEFEPRLVKAFGTLRDLPGLLRIQEAQHPSFLKRVLCSVITLKEMNSKVVSVK